MAIPKLSPAGEKTKKRTGAAADARSYTGSAQGAALFVTLRKLLRPHEAALVVVTDRPGDYELATRTLGANGKPLFFGGVRTSRSHTTFYLAALAGSPELLESISEPLRRRLEGNASFVFKTLEPGLFEELSALTARCLEAWKTAGKLG